MSFPQLKDPQRVSRERNSAQMQVRLFDPASRKYLHMSGQGFSRGSTWSWRGYQKQARALRQRALSEGREWPFVAVPADDVPPSLASDTSPVFDMNERVNPTDETDPMQTSAGSLIVPLQNKLTHETLGWDQV